MPPFPIWLDNRKRWAGTIELGGQVRDRIDHFLQHPHSIEFWAYRPPMPSLLSLTPAMRGMIGKIQFWHDLSILPGKPNDAARRDIASKLAARFNAYHIY